VLRRLPPALLLLVVLAAPGAAALRIPPAPDHRVNDYAGALAPADRDRLEQALIAREASSRNQVVVAIFRSLEGESLEDYSIRLAQQWRIGQKGLDNGLILLVFALGVAMIVLNYVGVLPGTSLGANNAYLFGGLGLIAGGFLLSTGCGGTWMLASLSRGHAAPPSGQLCVSHMTMLTHGAMLSW